MATPPTAPILTSQDGTIRPFCEDSQLTFYWGPPQNSGSASISSYTLTDEGALGPTVSVPSGTIPYTISSLDNVSTYSYSIFATNNDQESGPKAYFRSVQPGLLPPAPPTASAILQGTTATISWTHPTFPADTPEAKWYVIGYGNTYSNTTPISIDTRISAYNTDTIRTIANINTNYNVRFNVFSVNDPGYSQSTATGYVGRTITSGARLYIESSNYVPNAPSWSNLASNDSTILGSPFGVKLGGYVYFSGSNMAQYFTYPDFGQLDQWTFQTWFRPVSASPNSNTGGYPMLFMTGFSNGGNSNLQIAYGWDNQSSNGWCGQFVNTPPGFIEWRTGSTLTLAPNTWYNLAVSWDNATQTMKSYVNGTLYSSSNIPYSTVTSGFSNFIGKRPDTTATPNGYLGNLLVYDRILTDEEVLINCQVTSNTIINYPTIPLNGLEFYLSYEYYDTNVDRWYGLIEQRDFLWQNVGNPPSQLSNSITIEYTYFHCSNITSFYSSFTLATWFNSSNIENDFVGLFSGIGGVANETNMTIHTFDGTNTTTNTWHLGYRLAGGTWETGPGFSFTPNQWYHMAYTFDTQSSTIVMYSNGILTASTNVSYTPDVTNTTYSIGQTSGLVGTLLRAKIGNFVMYNRALTPTEINQVYQEKKSLYIP